jgi:hypothetical protein
MTVIVGLLINDVPALLGDVLITAPRPSDKQAPTPTLENANSYFEPHYAHVPRLRQKVNILNDKVIVAWAGSPLHARALLREMKEALDGGAEPEAAIEIVRSWPEEDKKDISIIGLARGPKITRFVWNGEILHVESSVFKKVVIGGSGMNDVGALIRHMEKGNIGVEDRMPDTPKMPLYALALGSQAAGWEYITQENLSNSWGGIVETGMFNGGVASKVGEILYSFWEFDVEKNMLVPRPTFIKQEYQGDLMVTYTLSADEGPRVVVVPPLLSNYRDDERIEVAPPTLTYRWICSCIVVREGNETVDIFSTVERCDDKWPVSFTREQSIDLFRGGLVSSKSEAKITRKYVDEITQLVGNRLHLRGGARLESN